ncbi:leucine-rich repeat extensin-like protein 3 [Chenopodium quinoa]|uniref:Pollen Ole e 1 allergen and extensin family protein n=1 Tax=Chenopodium quinoa TaxID=63459 RepID=A0A803L1D4_CHEQI|nr:leucine-rich repeat extensin-like protein 3 [Chenopodium quinoa]
MSHPMNIMSSSLFFVIFFGQTLNLMAQSTTTPISSRITVVGAVYCDTCLNDGFSKHSYFIPGADVHIQCKFNAKSPKTAEMINFSVNRTTDIHGVYKLEIPSVDGIDCVDGPPIQSFCQASLLGSPSSACNVPALKATTTEVSVKSRKENLCVYSFTSLSFKPRKKNDKLCRKPEKVKELSNSGSSSKSLLPHDFPLPNQKTSKSQASNLQSFPFPFSPPSLPFPFPFSSPPSLPFPFSSPAPSLPFPFPPVPSLFQPPPPPSFSLGDPRTWIPHIPLTSPPSPPPPVFDIRNPRTWTPIIPPLTPPKP